MSDDSTSTGIAEPPSRTKSARPATGPEITRASNATTGRKVFEDNCAGCHGDDGGGGTGPELKGNSDAESADRTVNQIREGGGGMPAFDDRLERQELADVAAYVTKDLAPDLGPVRAPTPGQ